MNPLDVDELHEMILRLGCATFVGIVLGIDRDLHKKPAGLRVLAMVSLGSCAITMVSISSLARVANAPVDGVLRTVQGILSGIGFLGAGAIMRLQGKDEVHGLTTAASIWICAILGMISALGQWTLGLCTFVFAWVILVFGSWAEHRLLRWTESPKLPVEKPSP